MNPGETTLQMAARTIALLDLMVAILALLLNWRSRPNRYLAGMLMLLGMEGLIASRLVSTVSAAQAEPWLLTLSGITLVIGPIQFLITLSLLRSDSRMGKRLERWLWRLVHLFILLSAALILSDARLGTHWLYVGPVSQTYKSGVLAIGDSLQGTLARYFHMLNLFVVGMLSLPPIIYALRNDDSTTKLIRLRARWLLIALIAGVISQNIFLLWFDDLVTATLTSVVLTIIYSSMLLLGVFPGDFLRKRLANVPLRPKLYIGLGAALTGLLVVSSIAVYNSIASRQLVRRALARQQRMADLTFDINSSLLTVQNNASQFYDTWAVTGFERIDQGGFDGARKTYIVPLQAELAEIRDYSAQMQRLESDSETSAPLEKIITSINTYETALITMSEQMERLGYRSTGEMSQMREAIDQLQRQLNQTGLEPLEATLLEMSRYERDFFVGTDLASARLVQELNKQLREQVAAANDDLLAPADKTQLNDLLERYGNHFLAAASQHLRLQESQANLLGQSGLTSVLVNKLFERQQVEFSATAERLQVQQSEAIITVIGLALVTLFTSSAAGFFVANQIIRPVTALGETASRLGSGDVTVRATIHGTDEVGATAAAFNVMADRVQELLSVLERQVAERTRDLTRRTAYLEASAKVGHAVTSILSTDQLLHQVVELIREQFGLYYVGLFLRDERGSWARLRAGTGKAGQDMLARGHRIRIGDGMIGWSIANAGSRVAREVGEDAVRLATAELPDTRSEAAIPLRSRGRVLGALSVQDTQPHAFDETAIAALQAMADQVAVALDNARLFDESQAALEAERRAYGELSRDSWAEFLNAQPNLGFRSDPDGVSRVRDASGWWEREQKDHTVQPIESQAESRRLLSVPIKIRENAIGVVEAFKPHTSGDWSAREMDLVERLTEELSLALESARLFRDAQRRAAREQLIGEASSRMRETLDIETVLRTAVDELYQKLGLDEVTICLSSDGNNGRAHDA